jgi:hypothetical protein
MYNWMTLCVWNWLSQASMNTEVRTRDFTESRELHWNSTDSLLKKYIACYITVNPPPPPCSTCDRATSHLRVLWTKYIYKDTIP